mgnify:CR=1 FL=1
MTVSCCIGIVTGYLSQMIGPSRSGWTESVQPMPGASNFAFKAAITAALGGFEDHSFFQTWTSVPPVCVILLSSRLSISLTWTTSVSVSCSAPACDFAMAIVLPGFRCIILEHQGFLSKPIQFQKTTTFL